MLTNDYDSSSFVGREDIVEDVIRRVFAHPSSTRNVLIEAPANRGKSWLLRHLHEILTDPTQLHAILPQSPPIASFVFTNAHAQHFDPLLPVACVWCTVHTLMPSLVWPLSSPAQQAAIPTLYNLFKRDKADAQTLIARLSDALQANSAPILLALLIDGLDEFDELDPFERQFVEPLFRSPHVRVVSTRRSQVLSAKWNTFSLRPHKDDLISLTPFSLQEAIEQLNRYFKKQSSVLTFNQLAAWFKHYNWQNPGANRRFAEDAITNQSSGFHWLIHRNNVRSCLLDLSKSGRFDASITDTDLDWLIAVVHHFPDIGVSDVPTHNLNTVLSTLAQRTIGDKERNEWLGRLQDRAIVVRRPSGQSMVHEEFAALCQELGAQQTP